MTKTATKKTPKAAKTTRKRNGPSRRSQQRLLALHMGLEKGTIQAADLREACRNAGCYNAPNFTQDMKKEEALFTPTKFKPNGKTAVAWKLTTVGRQIAKKAPPAPKGAKTPKPEKTEA